MSGEFKVVLEARKRTRELLCAGSKVEAGMREVVEMCAERCVEDWSPFRWVQWGGSAIKFAQRFRACLESEPPEPQINGLWLGLFNPVVKEETILDCYLAGNDGFAPEAIDWPCGPKYWPEARYFEIPALAELYRLANENADRPGSSAEQALGESFVALSTLAVVTELAPKLPILNQRDFGISYGFDSGDFLFLGTLAHGQFRVGTNDAPRRE